MSTTTQRATPPARVVARTDVGAGVPLAWRRDKLKHKLWKRVFGLVRSKAETARKEDPKMPLSYEARVALAEEGLVSAKEIQQAVQNEVARRTAINPRLRDQLTEYEFVVSWPAVETLRPMMPRLHFAHRGRFKAKAKDRRDDERMTIQLCDPVTPAEITGAVDLFVAWAFMRDM